MRGHVRHRGDERAGSWEYIVDVGLAAAQRCQDCNRSFWIERRPLKTCPKCSGELTETEERRRETKAGFATQKECEAAMNKLLVRVEEQVYVPPTKASVREYLTKEWLPAVKATIRPTTYRSYEQHVMCHVAPHIGSVKLAKLTGSQMNHLYAKLAETGKKDGKTGLSALTIHHVHTCLHKGLQGRGQVGTPAEEPRRRRRPAEHARHSAKKEMKTWSGKQLGSFLESTKADRLAPLWRVLAMTGMRRGEVCGLRWEDVDLEKARLSVRRALIPHGDGVIVRGDAVAQAALHDREGEAGGRALRGGREGHHALLAEDRSCTPYTRSVSRPKARLMPTRAEPSPPIILGLVGRMSAVLPIRKLCARTRTTGNRQVQGSYWRRRPESNR